MFWKHFIWLFIFCNTLVISKVSSQCPTAKEASAILEDWETPTLQKLILDLKSCPENRDSFLTWSYHYLGVAHYLSWDETNDLTYMHQAIAATKEALRIRQRLFSPNSFFVGRSHANLGIFYFKLTNYQTAKFHLERALDIYRVNNDGDPEWEFDIALELVALNGNSIGDYEKCLDYFKIAINIAEEHKNQDFLSRAYTTYSNQLAAMAEFTKSLEIAKHGIQLHQSGINDPDGLQRLYLNAGIASYELGQYQQALGFYKKAQKINEKIGDIELDWKLNSNIGEALTRKKDYDSALIYLQNSLDTAAKYDDRNLMSYNFHYIGNLFLDQKKYKQALDYFHKSIIYGIDGFDDPNIVSNPTDSMLMTVKRKWVLLEQIYKKASTWEALSREENKKENLKLALENYRLATQLIDLMRIEFTASGSKLHWLEVAYPILEEAIKVALELYQVTNEEKYKEAVLGFMEKNKAVLLLESVNRNKTDYFANIPDSLLEYQSNLQQSITQQQRRLLELQKENRSEDSLYNGIDKQLAVDKISLSNLEEKLKEEYPAFNQINKIQPLDLSGIRRQIISDKNVLIEYFVGDSITYVVGISKSKFLINSFSTATLRLHAADLLYVLNPGRRQKSMSKKFFQQFTNSSYNLYQFLLKNILTELPSTVQEIILIPDDVISYLPFDILLQTSFQSEKVNFSPDQLNYLIQDYSVTYNYSATVLASQLTERNGKKSTGTFLGYAPAFGGAQPIVATQRSCNFEEPEPLMFNQPEVERINEMMQGEIMIGKEANKQSFLEMVADYSILHLATHACADGDQSARNRIFFADDYLYNHELSNLNISADMVVLSACETGIGEFNRGEGVMSLARGFAYSGTPSITMSLWSVNDESTSELMIKFYHYLKEGFSKDQALRQSKLDYLSNQEEYYKLHPLFWAGFVHYGDTIAIIKKENALFYWLGGGLILLIFFFLFIKNKSLKENG